MSKIYSVEVQEITTGTGIEGYDCKTYVFLNKAKAFQYAYKLAKKYAIEHGLPKTTQEKFYSLSTCPCLGCKLDKKECLATIEEEDGKFDIKRIKVTGKYFEDYMKEQLEQGEVKIGRLKISNNYRWLDDGGYEYNGYAIYVFEKDFNEDSDVIYEAWFDEDK